MSFGSLGQLSNLGAWLGSLEASSEGSAPAGPPEQEDVSVPSQQDPADQYFNINKFQQLLDRLEASKKRQTTQKGQIGRGDIYAQGLASMMSNF